MATGILTLMSTILTTGAQRKAQHSQERATAADTKERARIKAIEDRKFKSQQKSAFLKSGVELEGTPLLVLEETALESERELDAIKAHGARSIDTIQAEGKARDIGTLGQAGASLLSGIK